MSRITPFSRAALAGVVGLIALPFVQATPANAQMVCSDHAAIDKRLRDGYKEVPAGSGLTHNGAVVTLYVSDKGTFTIVLTRTNGMSCLMAVGTKFFLAKPKTAGLDL